jgi:Family of unknown function (DUF6088)
MRETHGTTSTGIAPTIRARITKADDHCWRPGDFDDLANPNAVDQALADLHTAGELRRIRRGLYWRGRRTAFGMAPPPATAIIEQITGLTYGIGPSGHSAALALGLSTQVPRVETFALPLRPPTGLPEGIRVVSRSARRGRLDAKLRPKEVAWLEIAGTWRDHLSDPTDAADRFRAHLDAGEIRPDRIAVAARTEPPAVKQMIADLLRAAGRTEDAGRISLRPAA